MKGIKLLWLQWSLLVLFEHHCNTICCWNSLCILGWGEEIFLQLRLARKSKPLEFLERHFTTKICGVTIDAAKRMPQHLKKELRKRSCYRRTLAHFSFNMIQPVSFDFFFFFCLQIIDRIRQYLDFSSTSLQSLNVYCILQVKHVSVSFLPSEIKKKMFYQVTT